MLPPELKGFRPKERAYPLPTVNWRFCELDAAHFWRLTPWEFDGKEDDEKAEMLAFREVQQLVESYHYEMAERAAEAKDTLKTRNKT